MMSDEDMGAVARSIHVQETMGAMLKKIGVSDVLVRTIEDPECVEVEGTIEMTCKASMVLTAGGCEAYEAKEIGDSGRWRVRLRLPPPMLPEASA